MAVRSYGKRGMNSPKLSVLRFMPVKLFRGATLLSCEWSMLWQSRLQSYWCEENYKDAAPLISGLKAEGVEIALNAVDAAARAFGGEGYSDRVDIGDRLRDLNGLRIADGATDVMRSSVVSDRFGREFWEMAIQGRERKNDEASQGQTD